MNAPDKRGQDEYAAWGMTRRGERTPTVKGFTNSWDEVRAKYTADYPMAIFVRLEVAIPDQEALARGMTTGQLAEKSGG